jgi:hypothetical protein
MVIITHNGKSVDIEVKSLAGLYDKDVVIPLSKIQLSLRSMQNHSHSATFTAQGCMYITDEPWVAVVKKILALTAN